MSTNLSPTNKYSTLLPLLVVLAVSMVKDALDDVKRHRQDATVNFRQHEVFRQGVWAQIASQYIQVNVLCLHVLRAQQVSARCAVMWAGLRTVKSVRKNLRAATAATIQNCRGSTAHTTAPHGIHVSLTGSAERIVLTIIFHA